MSGFLLSLFSVETIAADRYVGGSVSAGVATTFGGVRANSFSLMLSPEYGYCLGDKWMAREVAFAGGTSVGRLGALLAAEDNDFYKWIDTTRLDDVSFDRDEATGAVAVSMRALGGRAADHPDAQAPSSADAVPPETDAEKREYAAALERRRIRLAR